MNLTPEEKATGVEKGHLPQTGAVRNLLTGPSGRKWEAEFPTGKRKILGGKARDSGQDLNFSGLFNPKEGPCSLRRQGR